MSGVPFNPHEVLMRLRAKNSAAASVQQQQQQQQSNNNNSTPLSNIARQDTTQSDFLALNSSSQSIASFTIAAAKSSNNTSSPELKVTQDSIVLLEEASHIRFELETEMARIQQEMKGLRRENAKLKEDMAAKSREFEQFKTKSEEQVIRLRGKMAAIALGTTTVNSSGAALPSSFMLRTFVF
jgi:hypothetical protein